MNIVLHKWPSLAFQRYEIEHSKRNSQWEKNCDSHSLLNFVDSMTQHEKNAKSLEANTNTKWIIEH